MLDLAGVTSNESMSAHTTFGVGGPAEYFFVAKTVPDLVAAVKTARSANLPLFIFGGGSNLLVADRGVKGLVIKNLTNQIKVLDRQPEAVALASVSPRFEQIKGQKAFPTKQSAYDENQYPAVLADIDSGVKLARAIHQLLSQGVTGLEWFAGIPATVGGAVYINAHGGPKFISDYLVSARILTPQNEEKSVAADYFSFGYDTSRLKITGDIVLAVTLRLFRGPIDKARGIATAWARHKANQPQRSAGCIFQNLSLADEKRLKLPTSSGGYLIEKVLNLKGSKIGNAQIADRHAGFIENLGAATASDVFKLIKLVKDKAKKNLDLNLKLEIVPVGFSDEELKTINES
ncbi:MAG: UDP-N-acetylenolpyruvoylglucosamine reductase [Candidatus Beckwithbacteria bacterium GW2011_GWB1_47_15]|uniref:UDP-N-acetylenolpyruvoylglucosamine reductase n=1 Tax=Candidatus Beckwithbacteria bacterium GW2011_GWB1_47_15 TaxID=1618371 RepID=A0A0G1UVD2_9BACT|nr:MAG: UDP-N-acetylmuramate dehydrogenase [Candidatus Beckwithbacteria bacterium GW2011_GWC1_49_16]KKU35601.1 MAG: UDP-N-acetylenolpyruvoylglucosamine reductase [Candidatus Beckwithbacteria bacterium GW2011_GWA1_46_30]KKU61655.1 MAG: UDP-N-acetylenolpyruvoylglucosamine reductase [Candidatus Beckwithbacteria bacterium GW2011_GWB1_47_15]KKU72158.1 MAG: UDP-N-acetylenolpyruvoylglucosamine reductase [Candidatus Beckwithbacteria bacterium GW2011_GWA2_47_25]KKW04783.1 MAG: UDP-N-acetylenolpyruvoylgl